MVKAVMPEHGKQLALFFNIFFPLPYSFSIQDLEVNTEAQ